MKTLKLTDKDFKKVGTYREYIGKENLADFEGNIEFAGDLGRIKLVHLKASGYISIEAGDSIEAGGSIEAGDWIEAGGSIKAGDWIRAGGWIEAGDSIEAVRGGICTGLYITCKGLLRFKLRLFAGTMPYSWIGDADTTVTCGKLEGNVAYGDVIETGLPDDKSDTTETIELNGKTYKLVSEVIDRGSDDQPKRK